VRKVLFDIWTFVDSILTFFNTGNLPVTSEKLNILAVLLRDDASDWHDTLPADKNASWDAMKTAFQQRFQDSELLQIAGNWLRHFENYCTYKELTEVQKQNLFRVLMAGSAADWLENVRFEDANNVTFND